MPKHVMLNCSYLGLPFKPNPAAHDIKNTSASRYGTRDTSVVAIIKVAHDKVQSAIEPHKLEAICNTFFNTRTPDKTSKKIPGMPIPSVRSSQATYGRNNSELGNFSFALIPNEPSLVDSKSFINKFLLVICQ